MSYCRWSSDNWQCDLYCYENTFGSYSTHVAKARYGGEIPVVPDIFKTPLEEWCEAHKKQMDYLKTAKRIPIDLPYAGESFDDPDLPSLLKRIKILKEVGYYIPAWIVPEIEEEIMMETSPAGA